MGQNPALRTKEIVGEDGRVRYSYRREDLSAEKITMSLPIRTSAAEVLDTWISAVVARVGTQREASYYLDMAEQTISRRLSHRRRQTK